MTDTRELPGSCPFCGSNRIVVDATGPMGTIVVDCLGCNCSGPAALTHGEAIRRWNMRKSTEDGDELR